MNQPHYLPEDPQGESWDVIVIGTGMGGSTVGYGLARAGRKVLFLEKGHYLFGDHKRGAGALEEEESTEPAGRLNEGRWPNRINGRVSDERISMFAPLGCGTGGSSGLYAAQLERLLPSDLEPRKHHPDAKDSTLPETWPITYDELVPYYREAEKIFAVCGTQDPLNPDPESPIAAPPPASPRDAYIMQSFERAGLHPYRAHVGCRFIPGCTYCGGVLCPRECKTDSGLVCLRPAIEQHQAKLLPDTEVTRIEANGERVTEVHYKRGNGEEGRVSAKAVVVAAGSLMTPALLLKSKNDHWPDGLANRSDQVGRNLMMHVSDYIALRPNKNLSPEGPHKSISFNDFYSRAGKKLGTFQTVGMPVNSGVINAFLAIQAEKNKRWYNPSGTIGKVGRKFASVVGAKIFDRSTVFASIIEDLPYAHNRVVLDPSDPNGMRFEYLYPDELRRRTELYRSELKKALKSEFQVLVLNGESNLNYGHLYGTCRSGEDPEKTVVNRDNRAHHLANLYVADSSAFPSSGGTNPSLTIAANALRVADGIHRDL